MSPIPGSSVLKRAADSLSGFEDPSMGDEREHQVILRAYTFAMQIGMYLAFAFALLLALVGVGLWSITLVLVAGSSSWAAMWYCEREGVSIPVLLKRATPKRKRLAIIVTAVFIVAWVIAMSFHALTGAPLVPVDIELAGVGAPAVVGGLVGAVCGLLAAVVAMKRAEKRANPAADNDD